MIRLARIATVAAILASACSQPSAVLALQRPVPQTVLSRGAITPIRPLPVGRSVHNIFGTIVSLGRQSFVLRTRSGRLIEVDASVAMRLGTYSAPLFVGKVVVVGGSIDQFRRFRATTITRMTRLDATTPPDL